MLRLSPLPGKPPHVRLLEAVKQEVKTGRSQSLHKAVLQNLSKDQPQQLGRSWDIELKMGSRPSVQLPKNTSAVQIFDRTDGKLVILGGEGAGKTTMLRELGEKLVRRAEKDANLPIPVLFNLSSWRDDSQTIADWLVTQLQLKYSIPAEIGKEWLIYQKILPLLDGLDEVILERQERCIQAINQFLDSPSKPKYLVVCSSFDAYKRSPTRFRLRGAILLKPLSEIQIQEYLMAARSRELWYNIQNEPELLKLAKTPLLLSIMTLAYEEILIESWKRLTSLEERREYLLNAYIRHQMIKEINQSQYPKGKKPRPEEMRHWLVWLAKRMQQAGQREMSPAEMPTEWLQTESQQRIYKNRAELLAGLVFGCGAGLIVGLIGGFIWGAIAAVVVGIICGIFVKIPALENLALHLVLWQNGYIPWNYRRFLDEASHRLLLQKVGDRYQFVHQLLQQHFAQM